MTAQRAFFFLELLTIAVMAAACRGEPATVGKRDSGRGTVKDAPAGVMLALDAASHRDDAIGGTDKGGSDYNRGLMLEQFGEVFETASDCGKRCRHGRCIRGRDRFVCDVPCSADLDCPRTMRCACSNPQLCKSGPISSIFGHLYDVCIRPERLTGGWLPQ